MVIEAAMTTSDPRFAVSAWDSKLARLVHTGLTVVEGDDLAPKPYLAERLEMRSPLIWEATLRADARFSDGTPVLAADVVRTYQSVLEPGSSSLHHKGFSERYERVEAIDARRVRLVLKQPLGTLRSDLDFGIVSATGRGSGPFVLRELTSTRALLTPNPYFFGARPKLAQVEIKFVRDASARLLMLVGGSADLVQNSSVRMDLLDELAARPRLRIASSPSVILSYLMFNTRDPSLADLRVRQAIALAIDRPSLIAAKFGGRAREASGLLPALHWAFNGDVPQWHLDLPRARKLLDDAGLRDPDGDGPRPRLTLTYKTSSDAFRLAIARAIAAQLGEVGIAVDVRSFEFATFFSDVKKGQFQLASMQTSELSEPDYYYFYFHSSRIPSAANPDGGNRWRYASPEVDRLTEAGRQELDPAKRKPIYDQVQALVARDLPIVPLWHEDNVVVTNVDVEGYRMTPNARLVGLAEISKRSDPP